MRLFVVLIGEMNVKKVFEDVRRILDSSVGVFMDDSLNNESNVVDNRLELVKKC